MASSLPPFSSCEELVYFRLIKSWYQLAEDAPATCETRLTQISDLFKKRQKLTVQAFIP